MKGNSLVDVIKEDYREYEKNPQLRIVQARRTVKAHEVLIEGLRARITEGESE